MRRLPYFVFLVISWGAGSQATALPRSCLRSPRDMVRLSRNIALAQGMHMKRFKKGNRRFVRGTYRVLLTLKGFPKGARSIMVEQSCVLTPGSSRLREDPNNKEQCRGLQGLLLEGFSGSGRPMPIKVILFLSKVEPSKLDGLRVYPMISRTGYDRCDRTPWPPSTSARLELIRRLAQEQRITRGPGKGDQKIVRKGEEGTGPRITEGRPGGADSESGREKEGEGSGTKGGKEGENRGPRGR